MIARLKLGTLTALAANRWLWLALLAVLIAFAGFWTRGTEVEDASTPVGNPAMRWGYDPHHPTGERDAPVPDRPLPAGYRIETVVSGLNRPTQLAVAPDGRILVAEQLGDVRIVQDGRLLDEPLVSLNVHVPDRDSPAELGLTGLAVDPEFDRNRYLYLYYSAAHPRRTVIARVRDEDGGQIEEILSWEAAPECCHIGGGMRFAPDGTLLIGVGDHERPGEAQSPFTAPGTILRINPDGSWPDDNPFIGPVYAYGLRNPYDIAIDPETGRIFAGENGFFGQDAVLEIKAGANYGWPGFDFAVPEGEIEQPLIFYHNEGGTAGMEFYSSDVLGELKGHLLFCRFHTGTVHDVEFLPDGSVKQETILARPCTTDIITGPDGFIYFVDYVDGVIRRIVTGTTS